MAVKVELSCVTDGLC